jgi:hypothetical protein
LPRGRRDLAAEILALLREEKPTLVLERLRAEAGQGTEDPSSTSVKIKTVL